MARLKGKTRVATKDGQLQSGALNIVSTNLINVFNSQDDKKIVCGVVQFNISQGMANTHAIVFETGGISVLGTGSANLDNETLKLRVDPRSKKANLVTIAMVPVNVMGTFAKLDWQIDMAGAAGNVAAGAARTTGAIATLGLSLLVEKVAKETVAKTDDTNYCTPALAGKKIVPGKMTSASAPKKNGPQLDTSASRKEKHKPAWGYRLRLEGTIRQLSRKLFNGMDAFCFVVHFSIPTGNQFTGHIKLIKNTHDDVINHVVQAFRVIIERRHGWQNSHVHL
jgi:hypothetical protein